MKVETIKEIVKSVENDTAMSLAMLKVIQSGKLEEDKSRRGYLPDPIEKVVTWLEETYDELKAFVPFKYWNSPVLDKVWLNNNRDDIEIRFATGGVFIRLSDMKRYLDHSIQAKYSENYLRKKLEKFNSLSENEAVSLGYGKLSKDSKYVQAFIDRPIKVTRSGLYTISKPVEIVDNGTAICMSKLLQMKNFDFDNVKEEIKTSQLLLSTKDGYVDDLTHSIYKIDPKYNYVIVRLVGDVQGETCDKVRLGYTKSDRDKMIKDFLANREGRS